MGGYDLRWLGMETYGKTIHGVGGSFGANNLK
jgi:hypothetical protein